MNTEDLIYMSFLIFVLGVLMFLALPTDSNTLSSDDSFIGYGRSGGVVYAFYDFNSSVYKCPMVKGVYDCDYFMSMNDFKNIFGDIRI